MAMSNSDSIPNNTTNSFWNHTKVLIIGGCGMIGSQLVELLITQGAQVRVMDDLSRGTTRIPAAEYTYSDAGDEHHCRAMFHDREVIFNLAATVAGVIYNVDHHYQMFTENYRVLETPVRVAKEYHTPHYLQTSSVCVYAPEWNHPCLEKNGLLGDPHPANLGYALAKRMGERLAHWAQLPHAVIVRPSNVYGPRDYYDDRAHVIPALIEKCLTTNPVQVYGTGEEIREFVHSQDVARGMMLVMEHGLPDQAYNLGVGESEAISVYDLVCLIQEITGTTNKSIEFLGGSGGDPKRWSEITRSRDLGYSPTVSLRDGLTQTITWYREHILNV
jgi:GDP-L-fucose synthase